MGAPRDLGDADRSRIVGCLRLLRSDVAGERDAAGKAFLRLLDRLGLDIDDVIVAAASRPAPDADDWRQLARDLAEIGDILDGRERAFVRTILRYPAERSLTEKQLIWLRDLHDDFVGSGAWSPT